MIQADRLPTLRAERLSLRWLEERDIPALFEIFSDDQVTRYWSSPPQRDLGEAAKLLQEIHDYFHKHELYQWGVARREDDRILGTCTLASLDAQNRRAEIGFALGRDHWGKGYMREALATLLPFAYQDLDLHRIEADVDPRNAASLGLLESFGFQREGLLRERWLATDGSGDLIDTVFYGLLKREWENR